MLFAILSVPGSSLKTSHCLTEVEGQPEQNDQAASIRELIDYIKIKWKVVNMLRLFTCLMY